MQKKYLFDYPFGLRYECIKCTQCCGDTEKRIRHIFALKDEVDKISEVTGQPTDAFAQSSLTGGLYPYELKKNNGRCVFLKDKICTIYNNRPLTCRFYPFWLEKREDRFIFNFTGECPGLNSGKILDETFFRSLVELSIKRLGKI